MNNTYNENTPKIVGIATMSIIVVVAMYVFFIRDNNLSNNQLVGTTNSNASNISTGQNLPATPSASQSSATPTNQLSQSSTKYKDGSYTASINYRVPNGTNTIKVTMSIKNDSVESVKTDSNYSDYESQYYISGFENNIDKTVKGKSLSSLSVGRVGGASLTSNAFNYAIKTIRNEAS